jgi:predicted glycoside hydrolase/deacetylase ChbG (UPF0249 family)
MNARTPAAAHGRPLRRITLCVDDFGLHQGVDTSALLLMAMGRLGAVSVMVDAPTARAGAERLSEALQGGPSGVDVGLHLNLTSPFAASTAQSAAPRAPREPGAFRCVRLRMLIALCYSRLLDPVVTRREIHRQCALFERLFGRAPDHVDGHEHVHQLPVVRQALVDVLMQRYGWRRPWLRRTRAPRGHALTQAGRVALLGDRGLARLARRMGYAQNNHLLGIHGFTSDPLVYQDRIAGWLSACSDGDLLMCHPSIWTTEPGALLRQRMAEHDVLSGPGFEQQLAAAGVVLSRFAGHQAPTPDVLNPGSVGRR